MSKAERRSPVGLIFFLFDMVVAFLGIYVIKTHAPGASNILFWISTVCFFLAGLFLAARYTHIGEGNESWESLRSWFRKSFGLGLRLDVGASMMIACIFGYVSLSLSQVGDVKQSFDRLDGRTQTIMEGVKKNQESLGTISEGVLRANLLSAKNIQTTQELITKISPTKINKE